MRTFYLNFLLLLLPLSVVAQTISGTVTDAENNLPLPGVNISVENTTKGTTTDFDGKFVLNDLNANDIIVFQFLGYKSVRITYVGQNTLNISLETDTEMLDEIVLIGYGQTLKEDVTGTVEKVSAEEFNRGAIVSPGSLLAGKTAGVRVTQGSGAPGAGPEIRIRAGSTLSGSQDPLIVIDGVPLDQQNANLNTINPDEIQDFTILKDASATAIYGSRASNGVIIITTKKGKKNTPLEFTFDSQVSISEVREKVRVMSAGTFRDFITQRDDELNRNGH
ncbi:MAG: carboxypeptidase-like regulatory domain-containing protein [Flavobacteriaceae bacterium]|nr:carboxypeptidase-like regulatory domain-containing protein [Flavobacteriaceae bacterium]